MTGPVTVHIDEAPENGGKIILEAADGTKAAIPLEETNGFWFDHPDHGRIWVRVFEATTNKKT